MRIITRTKGVILDENIEKYINEKIGGLEKFIKMCHTGADWERLKPSCEVFVEISRETEHHRNGSIFRAEAKLHLSGKTIMAGAEGEDIRSAITEVKDEMQQEIKKYTLRKTELNRKMQRKIKTATRYLNN